MGYCTMLVFNRALYGNYIALAINPFMGPAHEGINSQGSIIALQGSIQYQKGIIQKYFLILIGCLYGLVSPIGCSLLAIPYQLSPIGQLSSAQLAAFIKVDWDQVCHPLLVHVGVYLAPVWCQVEDNTIQNKCSAQECRKNVAKGTNIVPTLDQQCTKTYSKYNKQIIIIM